MNESVNPQEVRLWVALAGRGCVGAVIGMILMADPWAPHGRTVGLFLAYLLADCALGVSNRHDISALVMLGGIAAVGLGVLLVGWPGPGTVALPWLLGLQAMVSGSLFLAGALSELRRVATTVVPHAA